MNADLRPVLVLVRLPRNLSVVMVVPARYTRARIEKALMMNGYVVNEFKVTELGHVDDLTEGGENAYYVALEAKRLIRVN